MDTYIANLKQMSEDQQKDFVYLMLQAYDCNRINDEQLKCLLEGIDTSVIDVFF